tara:strand:- start:10 stop:216 length:207 start_codon:yes stop_codon:yes gene_type:complete
MFIAKKNMNRFLIISSILIVAYFAMITYEVSSEQPSFDSQTAHKMTTNEIDDLIIFLEKIINICDYFS